MAKYIDRDAFLAHEREWYCDNCNRRKNSKGKTVYEIGDAPCRACDIGDVLDLLEDYPTADVVERDEGIRIGAQLATMHGSDATSRELEKAYLDGVEEGIKKTETKRKTGKWIDMGDFEQCSACKGTHLKEFESYYGKATWIKTPYCPNCGADMRGDDDV